MRLLLDTHALIWWLEGARGYVTRLAPRFGVGQTKSGYLRSARSRSRSKWRKGKFDAPGDLVAQMTRHGFTALPVTIEHGIAMLGFPTEHGDPFDRLLIARARCEGLTIVTADRAFAAYDVPIMPA